MLPNGTLLAWIERRDDEFLAALVGAPVADIRAPATRLCPSPAKARQWIEDEAAALGLPIQWLAGRPRK
ncbi:MAG TPA: hypothetical protein VG848_07145 [Acetobacteraceae bacterium]|jgi:hypothetical protein|nr:hypothetical protein [Acetobacteraceae bacterium]